MLKNKIQKRVIAAFCIVSGTIILGAAVGVICFEKNRSKKELYSQIFYRTLMIKSTVSNLMPVLDSAALKNMLMKVVSADPDILYFILSDKNGEVLISKIGDKKDGLSSEIATIKQITQPLAESIHGEKEGKTPARFVIYNSNLNLDIFQDNKLKAAENEAVLDAFWDIPGKEMPLGMLRVGFSTRDLKSHLFYVYTGVFVLTLLVLSVVIGGILLVLRKYFRAMASLSSTIQGLDVEDEGNSLKQKLAEIQFQSELNAVFRFSDLKRLFLKLLKRIVRNWDQLEDQVHALENELYHEQKALVRIKRDLSRQKKERKEIENRLLNVQKLEAVGTLAGGIAHEFNNLFMAITGYASLIQRQSEAEHPNAQKAQKILELVDKGSQSVKQLLGFARSGKYTPGLLNVNDVIWATLEMFKKTRKDLLINAKYTQGLWPIYADRSQIEHIVMNLLLNAAEAMPDTGQVDIFTHNILLEKKRIGMDKIVSGRFVHFSIQDQGKGIETKYLRRIFDPFFTTKPFSSSSGLGLASVYGIVDNHGGFTTVESTLGKGSVFNVFFPALKEDKNEKSI